MLNLYQELGCAPTATEAELKQAYRRLAGELHPDRTNNDATKAERFKRVTAAWEILGDATKRAEYDKASQKVVPQLTDLLLQFGQQTLDNGAQGLKELAQRQSQRLGARGAKLGQAAELLIDFGAQAVKDRVRR